MLAVQEYLQNKTFEDLSNEFGIKIAEHPEGLPLVILNYDQIESPKTHPVIRECRALVLHKHTKEIVAKSFNRFFNWGEVQEELALFDFSDFVVDSKEDGSLAVIYHFDGRWHANTRGSFALDNMQFQDFTWQEGFCKALGISGLHELNGRLDESLTYVAEFCSPWNKVVRKYDTPCMYLLTAFRKEVELLPEQVDVLSELFLRPKRYNFCGIEEIQAFLQEQAATDATFEGVVIRDRHGRRYKIKSSTYLGLHRLRGEGDNVWNPKHLLPFVLAGEESELLTYFPEVGPKFYELKSQVLSAYSNLVEVWADNWRIPEQKDFALAIKDASFSSVLFTVRKKYGDAQKAAHVRQEFRENEALIIKKLLKTPA